MAEPAVSTPSSSISHTEAPADLDELIAVQEEIFCERQHESRRLAQRADLALAFLGLFLLGWRAAAAALARS